MYGKVIILAFLAVAQVYGQQPLVTPTCGNVQVPNMTPAQLWNPWAWSMPGAISASDCYTQWLISAQNSLNAMYNQVYTAGPPSSAGQAAQQATGAAGQATGGLPTQQQNQAPQQQQPQQQQPAQQQPAQQQPAQQQPAQQQPAQQQPAQQQPAQQQPAQQPSQQQPQLPQTQP